MVKVIRNKSKTVMAYRLGDEHETIKKLIAEKKIVPLTDGNFEVMSYEAFLSGAKGELAAAGDYIKVDSSGFPYPNKADYFSENHRHISGDEYEIIQKPLDAWIYDEPMSEEIEFLIAKKGLVIDRDSYDKCFSAPLWGTLETAARDAVIVFYSISRDENGSICDADFNFVCRSEFDKIYSFC